MFTNSSAAVSGATSPFSPIRIQNGKNGPEVASARELYERLGFEPTHWSRWHKKNILNNPFAKEGEDWIPLASMANAENQGFANPNPTADYVLTIDFAKRLCMLARTYTGEAIRRYFIQCERDLQNQQSGSPQITGLVELVNTLTERVIELERRLSEAPQRSYDAVPRYKYGSTVQRSKRAKSMEIMGRVIARGLSPYDVYWNSIWNTLRSDYNLDIKQYDRGENEHWIDVALRIGAIDSVYEIVYAKYGRW